MKAVVAAFNQEKALVGAFSVITNLRIELFQALYYTFTHQQACKMLYRAEDGCKVPGPPAGVLVSCCGDDGMMGSAAAIWCPPPLHSGRGEGAVCL